MADVGLPYGAPLHADGPGPCPSDRASVPGSFDSLPHGRGPDERHLGFCDRAPSPRRPRTATATGLPELTCGFAGTAPHAAAERGSESKELSTESAPGRQSGRETREPCSGAS